MRFVLLLAAVAVMGCAPERLPASYGSSPVQGRIEVGAGIETSNPTAETTAPLDPVAEIPPAVVVAPPPAGGTPGTPTETPASPVSNGSTGSVVEAALELNLTAELFDKIRAQGVPERALRKIFDAFEKNLGAEYLQDTYVCAGKDPASVRPCEERKRIKATKKLVLVAREYAAVVDFNRPSTEKRFFLIRLTTGDVTSFLASHGRGSGEGLRAWKFSNTKDSHMTSLGLYMTGEVYNGGYGPTLRMYGLEKSNDQAYNRDIVLHGAYYAAESFLQIKNPKTGRPFDRLGLSWGCPAVAPGLVRKIIAALKGGALIYHEHDLAEDALAGTEVAGLPPAPVPRPRPEPPTRLPEVIPLPRPKPVQSPVVVPSTEPVVESPTPVAEVEITAQPVPAEPVKAVTP